MNRFTEGPDFGLDAETLDEELIYKVWVPIVDSDGNQVDFYREDWHQNDSPEAAAEQGYLMACEETWGENNEFKPTREGIEVVGE